MYVLLHEYICIYVYMRVLVRHYTNVPPLFDSGVKPLYGPILGGPCCVILYMPQLFLYHIKCIVSNFTQYFSNITTINDPGPSIEATEVS